MDTGYKNKIVFSRRLQFAVIDKLTDFDFLRAVIFFCDFLDFLFLLVCAVTNLHLAAALVENRELHFSGIEFQQQKIQNLWPALSTL